jgi:hypothetical protein
VDGGKDFVTIGPQNVHLGLPCFFSACRCTCPRSDHHGDTIVLANALLRNIMAAALAVAAVLLGDDDDAVLLDALEWGLLPHEPTHTACANPPPPPPLQCAQIARTRLEPISNRMLTLAM